MTSDDGPGRHGRLAHRLHWARWPMRNGHPARDTMIGLAVAGYAWILAGLAPFTTASLVGVLIPGAVLGTVAYVGPPNRIPPPEKIDLLGMSWWIILVAALFEWEASAFKDNSRPWHPALTTLVNPLIGPHLVKSVAVIIWLRVGWGLVRR
jgi:hypothetical protein